MEYLIMAGIVVVCCGVLMGIMYRAKGWSLMTRMLALVTPMVFVVVMVGFWMGEAGLSVLTVAGGATLGVGSLALVFIMLDKMMLKPFEKTMFENENILMSIAAPMFVTDKDLKIISVNDAALQAAGYRREEVEGKMTCADFAKTPLCGTANCTIKNCMSTRQPIQGETVMTTRDGKKTPIAAVCSALFDQEGKPYGGMEVIVDQTEQKDTLTEVARLIEAATAGQLKERAEIGSAQGDYKALREGINSMLDAIVQPLNVTADYVDQISKGYIPSKITDEYKGDFDNIKNNLNRLIDSLTDMIGNIKNNADNLNSAAEQLNTAADQAGEASQQVATASQEMAKGAGEQATTAQDTAKSMQQLGEVVEQIAKGAQEQTSGIGKASSSIGEVSTAIEQMATNAATAADGSKTAADAAQEGANKAKQTVEGMERITVTVEAASNKVTELGTRSEEIGKIIAVIDDIAAQTNLLALNAAIEAARAGEHGRGFAVVSDEVRKLAERTAAATKEIADLISSVQTGVEEAVKAMEQGSEEVRGGYKLATEAGESLEGILKAATGVSDQINQISAGAQQVSASTSELVSVIDNVGSITEENTAAAEEMTASASQVSNAVESVASIAEQSSAATEQVSASAEEMGAQVEEIVASSNSLKHMAEELQVAVSAFKLNDDGIRNKVSV